MLGRKVRECGKKQVELRYEKEVAGRHGNRAFFSLSSHEDGHCYKKGTYGLVVSTHILARVGVFGRVGACQANESVTDSPPESEALSASQTAE